MKVYILTSGCYSDYSIEGVFSSREKAQEYADIIMKDKTYNDFNDIVETEVDNMYAYAKSGTRCFYGNIEEDGTLCFGINDYYTDGYDDSHLFDNSYYINPDMSMDFVIKASSKEHAIKIVNDKRAELIASNQWVVTNNKTYF